MSGIDETGTLLSQLDRNLPGGILIYRDDGE